MAGWVRFNYEAPLRAREGGAARGATMGVPDLRLLSLGAGVQSTTIALMAAEGIQPGLDGAIFADTGWEPKAVYDHLDKLDKVLADAGIPLYRVGNGNIRENILDPTRRFASIPYFIRNPDGSKGMGRRQCTNEYKVTPITRKIRELLGAKPPSYRRVPKGRLAEQWIGFSTDEIHRVSFKHRVLYLTSRFPLLDLEMSRTDCEAWLKSRGWTSVVKSACVCCPFRDNRGWRRMRDNQPDEFAAAVDFDSKIRRGGARGVSLRGEAFLHPSRVPLSLAPIDRPSRDELAVDPDGCSPYGCRSGRRVAV